MYIKLLFVQDMQIHDHFRCILKPMLHFGSIERNISNIFLAV